MKYEIVLIIVEKQVDQLAIWTVNSYKNGTPENIFLRHNLYRLYIPFYMVKVLNHCMCITIIMRWCSISTNECDCMTDVIDCVASAGINANYFGFIDNEPTGCGEGTQTHNRLNVWEHRIYNQQAHCGLLHSKCPPKVSLVIDTFWYISVYQEACFKISKEISWKKQIVENKWRVMFDYFTFCFSNGVE